MQNFHMSRMLEECSARRQQGDTAVSIAEMWSEWLISHLDDCIAATGSTGRGEALPGSDLDTIRLSAGSTPSLEKLISSGLIRPDSLGATAHSLALPQTDTEWRSAAMKWVSDPAKDKGVVKIGLLADASSPIHKEAFSLAPGSPLIPEMLRDALSAHTPRVHGWFSAATLHLKDELLTPLVKLARWGALAAGTPSRSTMQRFQLADGQFLPAPDLMKAYDIALNLRLDIDLELLPHGVFDRRGRIVLSALPRERRTELVTAVNTLRHTQSQLKYHLSTSAFAVDNGVF